MQESSAGGGHFGRPGHRTQIAAARRHRQCPRHGPPGSRNKV